MYTYAHTHLHNYMVSCWIFIWIATSRVLYNMKYNLLVVVQYYCIFVVVTVSVKAIPRLIGGNRWCWSETFQLPNNGPSVSINESSLCLVPLLPRYPNFKRDQRSINILRFPLQFQFTNFTFLTLSLQHKAIKLNIWGVRVVRIWFWNYLFSELNFFFN